MRWVSIQPYGVGLMFDPAALFASIAVGVSGAFGGPYFAGTLNRRQPIAYDDGGSILPGSGGYVSEPVQVQTDACTEAMRRADGYTGTDVRLLLLASGVAMPTTDDTVTTPDATYAVQSVDRDPVTVYYDLRGRVV